MQVLENNSGAAAGPDRNSSLRVFLVEDSPVIRERLSESISSLAHVEMVGTADTEAQAIAALEQTACDAVVLDLQLKRGHGFNVLRTLRGPTDRPRVTVIVLTNFASSQYRDRSMQMGADYFFDKAREYDRVCDVLEKLALTRARNPG
jgi:DNA-binding NarL/FixJ family response regulator